MIISMKKLTNLLPFFFSVILFSCGSDDNTQPPQNTLSEIFGEFRILSQQGDGDSCLTIKLNKNFILGVPKGYEAKEWSIPSEYFKVLDSTEPADYRLRYISISPIKIGDTKISVTGTGKDQNASINIKIIFGSNTDRAQYEVAEHIAKKGGKFLGSIQPFEYGNKPKDMYFGAIINQKLWVCSYDTMALRISKEWTSTEIVEKEKTIDIGYGQKVTINPNIFTLNNLCENSSINKMCFFFRLFEKGKIEGFSKLYMIKDDAIVLLDQTEPVLVKEELYDNSAIKDWLSGFVVYQYSGKLANSYLSYYDSTGSRLYKSATNTIDASSIIKDFYLTSSSVPVNEYIYLNYDYYYRENPYLLVRRQNLKSMIQDNIKYIYFTDLLGNERLDKLEHNVKGDIVEFILYFTEYNGNKVEKRFELDVNTFKYTITK